MFNEKDMDRTDALGQCFREIGGEMLPPPDLVKAAKAGVRLHRRVGTATHVRRFAGAVVLYAACVALLLGTILLLPILLEEARPANPTTSITSPFTETTPSETTTTPAVTTINKPGDLPAVESLPVADQSSVGKTVELSLKSAYFYYYFDADSGKERLLVIDLLSTEEDGGILYIYETDLNGLDGLCKAIATPIQGKVLAVSTISFYEFMYASWGLEFTDLALDGSIHEAELISLTALNDNPNTAQSYFSIVDADQGEVVMLAGNMTEQDSEYLVIALEVMDRIITRFDLGKYM